MTEQVKNHIETRNPQENKDLKNLYDFLETPIGYEALKTSEKEIIKLNNGTINNFADNIVHTREGVEAYVKLAYGYGSLDYDLYEEQYGEKSIVGGLTSKFLDGRSLLEIGYKEGSGYSETYGKINYKDDNFLVGGKITKKEKGKKTNIKSELDLRYSKEVYKTEDTSLDLSSMFKYTNIKYKDELGNLLSSENIKKFGAGFDLKHKFNDKSSGYLKGQYGLKLKGDELEESKKRIDGGLDYKTGDGTLSASAYFEDGLGYNTKGGAIGYKTNKYSIGAEYKDYTNSENSKLDKKIMKILGSYTSDYGKFSGELSREARQDYNKYKGKLSLKKGKSTISVGLEKKHFHTPTPDEVKATIGLKYKLTNGNIKIGYERIHNPNSTIDNRFNAGFNMKF